MIVLVHIHLHVLSNRKNISPRAPSFYFAQQFLGFILGVDVRTQDQAAR